MWTYMTGPPKNRLILYDYQSTRSGIAVTTFLENFTGYLQTDGYGGYHVLQAKPEITAVGCWAHARRKFVEIIKANKKARKAAANIYSLIMTAKVNQIEPYRYLRYLLTELPKCKTQEQRQLLLPQHCKDNLLQINS